jgi:hypothetical protein
MISGPPWWFVVGEDLGYVVVGGQIYGVGGVKHVRQVVFYMVCFSRMVEGKVVAKGLGGYHKARLFGVIGVEVS